MADTVVETLESHALATCWTRDGGFDGYVCSCGSLMATVHLWAEHVAAILQPLPAEPESPRHCLAFKYGTMGAGTNGIPCSFVFGHRGKHSWETDAG